MKLIDEALRLVMQHAQGKPPERVPVASALGRVLAEDVASDIDSPPFDKSLVDGYAVLASDAVASAELTVIEEVPAGAVPTRTVTAGHATRIMTGAPIPDGAETVVMVEHTQSLGQTAGGADRVRIVAPPPPRVRNIMRRATSLHCQQTVLVRGRPIRALEVGLLCEVGRTTVPVIPPARVAVLATGDELVPADVVPRPGQIRNSNGPMLEACVRQAGAHPSVLGIGRDQPQHLQELARQGLEHDVLILSGGVSAGKLDLVPAILDQLGVRQIFHKVRLRPGKPLWFGVRPRDGLPATLVFGLPGNPVSSLVGFELFVRPALRRMMGAEDTRALRRARLATAYHLRGDRPTFHPSVVYRDDDGSKVRPLDWKGSADLCTLTEANCLAFFPRGDHQYEPGQVIDIHDL